MKTLSKLMTSNSDKIFLKSKISQSQTINYSSRKLLKTMEDENEYSGFIHKHSTQKSSFDEVIILKKKIIELTTLVGMQQKQIIQLQEVNKYLQMSNISKLDIIKNQRNFKQIITVKPALSPPPLQTEDFYSDQLIGPINTPKNDVPFKRRTSQMFKTTIMNVLPTNHDSENIQRPSILRIDREKTGHFNFIQKEETFKINSILDLNLKDSDAKNMYEQDGTIILLDQILKDEEHFIDMMQNAKQQKLSFVYDKFERIVLEHKQLFQVILRVKNLIKGAVQMTHSLLLDDALNTIKEQLIESMMCEQATCYIYDYEKKELWSRVAKGTHEVIRINAGQGIPGQVALDKELVNIKYAFLDPRFKQDPQNNVDYKSKSLLVCPIIEGDRCLGVLQCLNKYPTSNKGIFSTEDEQLIKIFAEFAGVVLGNAINHNQQNLQYNKLRHIIRSAIVMGQQVNHREDLIKIAQLRIQTIMNVDKAKIGYLGEGNILYFFDEKETRQQIQSDQGLMGQAIIKKEMVSSLNCYSDPRYNSKIDIFTNLPVVVIPILNPYDKEEVLGALQVVFLKNVSTMIFNEEIRLGRMDQEILNLYTCLIGEFLHISEQVPQVRKRKLSDKRSKKTIFLAESARSQPNIQTDSD